MLRRAIVALALIGLVAAIAGCGGGGGDSTGGTAAYLPLTVGNNWDYDFTDYTMTAAKSAVMRTSGWIRPKQVTARETVTLTNRVQIGGSEWFSALNAYAGEAEPQMTYVRHNAQGLMIKQDLADEGYYLLHDPLQVGTSWGVPFDPDVELRIAAVGQEATVLDHVYADCVIVENTRTASGEPEDVIRTWYAKDIGTVLEERRLDGELDYKLELVSYQLF